MNENRKGDSIPIVSSNKFTRINIEAIQFVEQHGKKLYIVTDSNEEFRVYGRIEDISDKLVGKNFYRVMKSLVINFDKIDFVSKVDIRFISGLHYGVGRNNMAKIRKAYKKYILGYAPFTDSIVLKGMSVAEEDHFKNE